MKRGASRMSINEGSVMREKYWSELDDQEKIERLRSEVKTLKSQLETLHDLKDMFDVHSHRQPDGQAQVPAHRSYRSRAMGGFQKLGDDEVYF
jgi:hypothetical protein